MVSILTNGGAALLSLMLPGMAMAGTPPQSAPPTAITAAAQTPKTIDGHQVLGTIDLTATAYGPSLQDNYPYGATDYFGRPLIPGDVAVDPNVIPLGTRLFVAGYTSPVLPKGGFVARAVDEGDAIQGRRIDLFINAPESTVSNFGVQRVTAYILKN